MRIEKDFKEFIELLNEGNVRYLIIGGFAFSYYAEPRFTKDIDFLIDNTSSNIELFLNVLKEFGFGLLGLSRDDFMDPDSIVQLGYDPVRIDILTQIPGIHFDNAWANRTVGKYGDSTAYFISRDDLIRTKKLTGRLQDKADVEKLDRIKPHDAE